LRGKFRLLHKNSGELSDRRQEDCKLTLGDRKTRTELGSLLERGVGRAKEGIGP